MPDPHTFHATDFDAYEPSKWSSNVYNLERLKVKQKLEALGRALGPELRTGAGAGSLAWEVSAEHPALWNNHQVRSQQLYFLRNEEARRQLSSRVTRSRPISSLLDNPSPYREHIHLAVILSQDGIDLGLRLTPEATVDYRNLLRKLENHWESSKFQDILSDLPSTFSVRVLSEEPVPISQLDPAGVAPRLKEAFDESSFQSKDVVLSIDASMDRGDPRLGSPAVLQSIKDAFSELMPLFEFIEWRRDNDYLEVQKEIEEEKQKARSKGLSAGDRVRVIEGMWAGKKGRVQSTDSRGQVKVVIGKITVQLDAGELVRAG
jgi:hypothetical protein